MSEYFQQGDVLLKKALIPSKATPTPFDGVLQHGEATGHKHAIENFAADETDVVYLTDASTGKRYLRLIRPRRVLHEEHKPIEIPAGDYALEIVREYDHFDEEARAVID